MKPTSFFRRYLIVHFLSLVLVPLMLLMMIFGAYPAPNQASSDTVNMVNGVSVTPLQGGILLVAWALFAISIAAILYRKRDM